MTLAENEGLIDALDRNSRRKGRFTHKEGRVLPNGVRLSCGAELERSQTEDYRRRRGAVSFRRLLGGGATRSIGSARRR